MDKTANTVKKALRSARCAQEFRRCFGLRMPSNLRVKPAAAGARGRLRHPAAAAYAQIVRSTSMTTGTIGNLLVGGI
jgi:hypothetical protein